MIQSTTSKCRRANTALGAEFFRLIEKVDPTGYKLGYGYDLQGNRTRLSATVGSQVFTTTYTYDALNRVAAVTDPQGGVTTLAYDFNGNRARLAHPNGVATDYVYDKLNRLRHLATLGPTDEVLASYDYTLGLAGNRTRIDEHDGTSRHYDYDDLYRLTQDRVTDASGEQVYQRDFVYDPVGNRLQQTIEEGSGPTVVDSTYDDRNRLLTSAATAYGWDANGNLTSHDGSTYAWDYENRLIAITPVDGTFVETTYDADGNRVRTLVTAVDDEITSVDYLVDAAEPLSHVVAEVAGGSVQALYIRAVGQLIGSYRPAATTRYYHGDGSESVRALSDEAGAVTDRYRYTAFGELTNHLGQDPNGYLFTGEPLDASTGLYYLRARWMSSDKGRFLSVDPLPGITIEPRSAHSYTYAAGDPVNMRDPTGMFFADLGSSTLALAVSSILATVSIPLTKPPAIVVKVDPILVDPANWSATDIEAHLTYARKTFSAQRIYLDWDPPRPATIGGRPFVKVSFTDTESASILGWFQFQRAGSKALPLAYIQSIRTDDGYLTFKRGRTYTFPSCEQARMRGSVITHFALLRPIVTAHELGHAIGCLPHKKASDGWGPEWLMREPDPKRDKLDDDERSLLHKNTAGIP